MNLLDLVPAFSRHLKTYRSANDTDSKLAAYLADGVEALMSRWNRTYAIELTPPETYVVSPDIEAKDKRAIVLMASIIYKMGNVQFAMFRDQDFVYDPQQGRQNPLQVDIEELKGLLPTGAKRLAKGFTAPMRGFNNVVNPESYAFLPGILLP